MKFKYHLTDQEFQKSLRLNHAAFPRRWQAHLFVAFCLIPSLIIFWVLDAGLSLIWFGVMLMVMVCYALHAYATKSGYPETYDQETELNEFSYRNTFSHSVTQFKWALVERIDETARSFFIQRLSRYWMIPKRVLGSQVEACREFFERAQSQPLDNSPIELYQQVFDVDLPYPVYRFKYQISDLETARKTRFENVSVGLNPQPNRYLNRIVWVILTIVFFVGVWLIKDAAQPLRISPLNLLAIVATWFLPVLWLVGYNQLQQWTRRRYQPQIPPDFCELRLAEKGWAIGDQHGVVFFDWRDVSGIFHSPDFFGFKTVNQFLNIIPRRIFSDHAAANRFLAQAMDLRQRAMVRESVPVATAVESGNPYQAPLR